MILTFCATVACMYACGQNGYNDAGVAAFDSLVARPNVVVLDVRTQAEYQQEHIEGAVCIDYRSSGFMQEVKKKIMPSSVIAVYCRSGKRSAAAASLMAREGYLSVTNLKGGILEWKAQGKNVVR